MRGLNTYDLVMTTRLLDLARLVPRIALCLILAASAAAERRVIQVEDGITVEEENAAGRAVPIMIASTTIEATPDEVAAWVGAVHTYEDWQHNCEEARLLRRPDGSSLTYNRIGSPWPVSDRDVVLRTSREPLEAGGLRLEFRSTQADEFEVPSGVVRMRRLIGSYVLTPAEGGGTHIVYTVDSDPGGSLPAWLVRQAADNLPYLTLRNLKARVESGPPPASREAP